MADQHIEESNFQLFREILSDPIVQKCASPTSRQKSKVRKAKAGRKTAIKPIAKEFSVEEGNKSDAEDLGDFIDVCSRPLIMMEKTWSMTWETSQYLASEIFTSLPQELRTLTYSTWLNTPSLNITYSLPLTPTTSPSIFNILPLSILETLQTYSLLSESQTVPEFLTPVLNGYLTSLTSAPPPPSQTKDAAEGCEICERDWIPLTYHHLIPKSAHARVIKRGWHPEDQLNNVACMFSFSLNVCLLICRSKITPVHVCWWCVSILGLCRACHSFVHRAASAEELAKDFYTVERLMAREDVLAFAKWVGGVRWKSRWLRWKLDRYQSQVTRNFSSSQEMQRRIFQAGIFKNEPQKDMD